MEVVDRTIDRLMNPRQQGTIENYRRHANLEVCGLYEQILTDLKDDTTDRRESSWPDRRPAEAEGQNRPRRTVETEGGRGPRDR